MKIYFAGSIRGGRDDEKLYLELIEHLQQYGEVLTEHVGKKTEIVEDGKSDQFIHDRDMAWLLEADVMIAEVTTPSLGVGYELGIKSQAGKPIMCLYRMATGRKLSAMIAGCPVARVFDYKDVVSAKSAIDEFMREYTK